ncbi:TPA: hypothetical protein ENX78_14095 [Candidatus Poribacteria bacterium]|nr:hypothetical protein [Candidatus Poribacteria bacterium]
MKTNIYNVLSYSPKAILMSVIKIFLSFYLPFISLNEFVNNSGDCDIVCIAGILIIPTILFPISILFIYLPISLLLNKLKLLNNIKNMLKIWALFAICCLTVDSMFLITIVIISNAITWPLLIYYPYHISLAIGAYFYITEFAKYKKSMGLELNFKQKNL